MKPVKTIEDIEELCNTVKPCSRMAVNDVSDAGHVNELESMITELKKTGKTFKGDSIIKGISAYEYSNDVLYIDQKGVLFPSPRYGKSLDTDPDFGPTTGVILHCFDPEHKLYAMQVRGRAIDHSGAVQVGAAGYGEYRERFEETAVKELGEELKGTGTLVLPENTFLDALPFNVHLKPNVAFTYIAKTDLSKLPYKESIEEIRELAKPQTDAKTEVKNKFSVSLDRLGKTVCEIEQEGLFLGPQARTARSFIKWLENQ